MITLRDASSFKPWDHKMNIGGRVKESKGLGFFLFFPLAGLDSFSNSKQVRCTVDGDLSPALDYCCSLLVRFLALWSNTMTKSSWEGQGLFPLTLLSLRLSSEDIRGQTKVRNSETENEAEIRKERYLPACSPWLAQVTFLDTPRPQPRDTTTHCGLDPSHQLLIKTISPQTCPLASLSKTFSHLCLPIPRWV